jgi:hypothetical protein
MLFSENHIGRFRVLIKTLVIWYLSCSLLRFQLEPPNFARNLKTSVKELSHEDRNIF